MQFPTHVFTLAKILQIIVLAIICWGITGLAAYGQFIVVRSLLQALGLLS